MTLMPIAGGARLTHWTGGGKHRAGVRSVAGYAEHGRRCTRRSNQVQPSFEDTPAKQRALELVLEA